MSVPAAKLLGVEADAFTVPPLADSVPELVQVPFTVNVPPVVLQVSSGGSLWVAGGSGVVGYGLGTVEASGSGG